MRAELHGRLWANYPRVFTLRTEGPRRSNMSFGCECGDGWFGIVDRLCWCLRALWKLLRVNTQATQVKEKYGELRFYCVIYTPRSMPDNISSNVESAGSIAVLVILTMGG